MFEAGAVHCADAEEQRDQNQHPEEFVADHALNAHTEHAEQIHRPAVNDEQANDVAHRFKPKVTVAGLYRDRCDHHHREQHRHDEPHRRHFRRHHDAVGERRGADVLGNTALAFAVHQFAGVIDDDDEHDEDVAAVDDVEHHPGDWQHRRAEHLRDRTEKSAQDVDDSEREDHVERHAFQHAAHVHTNLRQQLFADERGIEHRRDARRREHRRRACRTVRRFEHGVGTAATPHALRAEPHTRPVLHELESPRRDPERHTGERQPDQPVHQQRAGDRGHERVLVEHRPVTRDVGKRDEPERIEQRHPGDRFLVRVRTDDDVGDQRGDEHGVRRDHRTRQRRDRPRRSCR